MGGGTGTRHDDEGDAFANLNFELANLKWVFAQLAQCCSIDNSAEVKRIIDRRQFRVVNVVRGQRVEVGTIAHGGRNRDQA
mmetsp:Transcript_22469/g.40507  ORF Transcript_22469/g.40507 Transcript_22469/m.40507 type:complete len:81 (+) Transcript_22469:207-449(+)